MPAPALQIVEVGARDGLQNEFRIVATEHKIALITKMIDAGTRRIEIASFVHPARVPQMADAEAVIAGVPDRSDVSYIGLCLNKRGVLRAIASREGNKRGVDEAGCVLVASDTFGQRNQGQTIAEGITENRAMIRLAQENGLKAQVTISAAFGCPFEGAVPMETVVRCAAEMAEAGAEEIALADTVGVGVPVQVTELVERVGEAVGDIPLRVHFHDTRGLGAANAWAAWQAGVRVVDASLGGLGGCPFAPNATGNVATEDIAWLFERSGIDSGIDLPAAIAVNRWFAGVMEKELPSVVSRAGLPIGYAAA